MKKDEKGLFDLLDLLFVKRNGMEFNRNSILYRFLRILTKKVLKNEKVLHKQIDLLRKELKQLEDIDRKIESIRKESNRGRRVTDYEKEVMGNALRRQVQEEKEKEEKEKEVTNGQKTNDGTPKKKKNHRKTKGRKTKKHDDRPANEEEKKRRNPHETKISGLGS